MTIEIEKRPPNIGRKEESGAAENISAPSLAEAQFPARIPRLAFSVRETAERAAVWHLTKKGSGIRSLEGLAGTGKTSTLAVVKEALEKAGYTVIGATTSGKAARELQDGARINSVTIAKLDLMMNSTLEYKSKHHERQMSRVAKLKPTSKPKPFRFDKKTVLIIDEAAMVSTKEMAELVAAVRKGHGMLINVFDRKQLQAIGPGGAAAFLADRHGKAELTEIVRQKDARDAAIVKAFAEGRVEEALGAMSARGIAHVAADREAAVTRLIFDWKHGEEGRRDRALIFAGTREEVAILNAVCQEERLRMRELQGKCYNKNGLSFYNGDRVLFTKNSTQIGVQNGSLGTVLEVKHFNNIASVKLDTGEMIQVPLKTYQALQLGYAVTTHKGQGTTVDHAYVLAGGTMQDLQLSYVQMSRARETIRLYTDENQSGDKLSRLVKQMEQDREKVLAHEIIRQSEQHKETLRIKLEYQIK